MSSPTVIRFKQSSLYKNHFVTVSSYYERGEFLCAVQTYQDMKNGYTALITNNVYSDESSAIKNFNTK